MFLLSDPARAVLHSARGVGVGEIIACVAGGMRERARGGRAAIFLGGEAREEFVSGEFNSALHQSSHGFATRVQGKSTRARNPASYPG